MLYRPEEQLIGRRVHDVFPGEAADWIVAQIRRAVAADSPIDVDYPLVIDGKTVWFNASVTRLNESSVIWVARDITARKLAEVELEARVADRTQDLQDSKERYRSVFDQAAEVIYTLSRDGIITSLNPAFEQILGWSRDEWIGKHFMGLVPAESFAKGTELFARLLRDGKIDLSRFIALAKDGRRVAFEFSVVAQILHGKSVGFLGVARDITERQLAEERLRRSER